MAVAEDVHHYAADMQLSTCAWRCALTKQLLRHSTRVDEEVEQPGCCHLLQT